MVCRGEILDGEIDDKRFRSFKLSHAEMSRKYMKGNAKKVKKRCACCSCNPSYTDEPPSNKAKAVRNKRAIAQTQKDALQIDNFLRGSGLPLMDGDKIVKNVKSAKEEVEVIVCHCHEMENNCNCGFVCHVK